MTTNLGKKVIYLDELQLQSLKSHDLSMTWSYELTRQSKTIISLLAHCLWPPNLASWWLAMRRFHPHCYSTIWSRGLTKSRDKLKSVYLNYHNIYDHKTKQNGDLLWVSFTHKVKWAFNHVVLADHVTNQNNYTSINTLCMAINFWGVRIYKMRVFFDPVVLQGHVNYFGCCIATTTRPMATKLCKVVTY